jgi:hypothetical protein
MREESEDARPGERVERDEPPVGGLYTEPDVIEAIRCGIRRGPPALMMFRVPDVHGARLDVPPTACRPTALDARYGSAADVVPATCSDAGEGQTTCSCASVRLAASR